ncbi:MAG TPA: DNA oxidative demethylase AlkB [Planctomycetota bacterium]|nr:DNA oxidative demethylase AlkB [Planctomycetota bacterium]
MAMQPKFAFMAEPPRQELAPGAVVLRAFARAVAGELLAGVAQVALAAPFRHMTTPGGHRMSVAMTNCGPLGWITDARGYRYECLDPASGQPWPALPASFAQLATDAAAAAGFPGFLADACLVNRYEPGARMTLHQDKDESDRTQPIVSVSLGLPMVFLFGGLRRADAAQRVQLEHGDVVVWGGPSRLCFHGVLPLREGVHEATGRCRINLTLRRAS